MGDASKKFMVAVHGMAASPKRLQMRILDAYVHNLIWLTGHEDQHLPVELRTLFAEVVSAMDTHQAIGDEGDAMASAIAMSDEEAVQIAEIIVRIYEELCSRE